MPLQFQDQLYLLKDILKNHQNDCCGSISECEQLERLIKTLLTESTLELNDRHMLNQVYLYSQSGLNSSNLNEHILEHQHQLSQWIENIDRFS